MKRLPERYIPSETGDPLPFHLAQNLAWDSKRRNIVLSAGSQSGKDIALDTIIPTPKGFVTMGEIKVGDYVYANDGTPTLVTYVSPIFTDHKCYKVIFDDGNEVVAGEDHQWLVQDANRRKNDGRRVKVRKGTHDCPSNQPSVTGHIVVKTKEMLKKMTAVNGGANWSIDVVSSPVSGLNVKLSIHPYLLGQWLGDGSKRSSVITTEDQESIEKIKSLGYKVKNTGHHNSGKAFQYRVGYNIKGGGKNNVRANSFVIELKKLGLWCNKHIPDIYLNSSVEDRKELLAGLLDSDGYCAPNGQAIFYSTRKVLFDDFVTLACSLGYKVRVGKKIAKCNEKKCGFVYSATFSSDESPFYISRKRKEHVSPTKKNTKRRYVYSVEEVETVPTKCISVAHESHTYLITKSYIPTHNTIWGPKWLLREIYHPEFGRGSGDYLAVTATFDLFKIKMLPAMLEIFCQIYKVGRYWSGDKIIELADPRTGEFWATKVSDRMWGRVILRSADSPGGLEAATAKGVWADEIGQERFTKKSYQAMRRRMTVHQARLLMTTTLYEPGWFLYDIVRPAKNKAQATEVFVDNDRGEMSYVDNEIRDTYLVQFDSTINPSFNQSEMNSAEEDTDEEDFAMFYKGREGSSKFLIYSNYASDKHLCPAFGIPPLWHRYIGVDYGGAHTCTVFYAENPDNNILYCYESYLAGQKDIKEHVKDILAKCGGRPVLAVGGSQSEDQWRREFGNYGIFVTRPNIGDVEVGIDRVNLTHKTDGIIYFDHLSGIIQQKETYRRVKNKETGEPTKEIHDKGSYHYLDAERYIISEIRPIGVNKVKVMSL